VGDFTYAPNREGLHFLVDEVMPRVWGRRPATRLSVAGRGSERVRGVDERVSLLGFVDDLRPLYETAACAIVPLLRGGGTPLKFIEALAHGLPVVATPRAAAGLEARPGEHYLEGSDAPSLAGAVVTALDGGGADAAAAGRALAERAYSIEALARVLAA
jgi:glycosyltransferase involved in cell wall biosynthesis